MALDIIDIKTLFGSWPKQRLDVSPDDLLGNMRTHGISRSVTVSASAILYDDCLGNQDTWQECAVHPQIIPAATIHPHNYLSAEGRIATLKEQGFRVFRFCNKLLGYSLDLYCIRRMLDALSQAGMPCIMDATALEDPYRMARLSQEHEVDIICTGLNYSFQAEIVALAADYPRLYFDAGRLTSPDGIELFCQHIGAHRLVYGSDYPFDDTLPSLLLLQQAEITEAERQRIASHNIRELLGI